MQAARRLWASLCVFVVLIGAPMATQARVALYEDEGLQLYLGGYLRSYSAWQAISESAQSLAALQGQTGVSDVGLYAAIGRVELKLSASDWFTAEVHSRLQWTMATHGLLGAGGTGLGVGVSQPPVRSLDLSSALVNEAKLTLDHDLDRLVFRFYLEGVDLSVGRQAVSWGNSNVFTVSDVWTTFSPFDLDTSQKRGVDALRAVVGLSDTLELDIILADRGSLDDLSGGARLQIYLDFGEAYVALAKTYEDLALAAGLAADVDTLKLRAEVMGRYDTERTEFEVPRATLGLDWFQSDRFHLGAELHLNGFGTFEPDDKSYLLRASQEEALMRGEGYLLGFLYAGTYLTYRPHPLVTLSSSIMMNLLDPSALLTWSAGIEVLQSVDLSLGGYHGLGEGFELGLYGHLGYLQLSAFF